MLVSLLTKGITIDGSGLMLLLMACAVFCIKGSIANASVGKSIGFIGSQKQLFMNCYIVVVKIYSL